MNLQIKSIDLTLIVYTNFYCFWDLLVHQLLLWCICCKLSSKKNNSNIEILELYIPLTLDFVVEKCNFQFYEVIKHFITILVRCKTHQKWWTSWPKIFVWNSLIISQCIYVHVDKIYDEWWLIIDCQFFMLNSNSVWGDRLKRSLEVSWKIQ